MQGAPRNWQFLTETSGSFSKSPEIAENKKPELFSNSVDPLLNK